MYKIKRFGRNFGKKFFLNYEDARSHVRKYIRKNKLFRGGWSYDWSLTMYRNPTINEYGFKIQKIGF